MGLAPDQEKQAIELAKSGTTLTEICRELGIPTGTMHDYRERNRTFDTALTRAFMDGVEAQTDRLLTIHEEISDPQRARLASDNIKWLAARRKPEVYGDRIDLNVNEKVEVAGALLEAKRRALQPDSNQELPDDSQDAEYYEVSEPGAHGYEPRDQRDEGEGAPTTIDDLLE